MRQVQGLSQVRLCFRCRDSARSGRASGAGTRPGKVMRQVQGLSQVRLCFRCRDSARSGRASGAGTQPGQVMRQVQGLSQVRSCVRCSWAIVLLDVAMLNGLLQGVD